MQSIIKYLGQYEEFEIVIFREEFVKSEPIEVLFNLNLVYFT